MGIMAAGFVKGASDAFTDRMYDVITKTNENTTKSNPIRPQSDPQIGTLI